MNIRVISRFCILCSRENISLLETDSAVSTAQCILSPVLPFATVFMSSNNLVSSFLSPSVLDLAYQFHYLSFLVWVDELGHAQAELGADDLFPIFVL